MRLFDRLLWTSALAIAPGTLVAQSCNIDLDLIGASQEVGGGVPSSTFGAAAGSPGYWCDVDAGGPRPAVGLFGLDGNAIAGQVLGSGIGAYGGFNSRNSGDFKALFDDYAEVLPENDYTFTGFQPGRYLIYTYAVRPSGMIATARVSVTGSSSGVQLVTGPMPVEQFVLGVDYCVHELNLVGGSFTIEVSGSEPPHQAFVNGFQIVEVLPETKPIGLAAVAFGTILFGRRRRV